MTNLFTAALDELDKLSVTPGELESAEVFEMLMRADYLGYASIPGIPECLVLQTGCACSRYLTIFLLTLINMLGLNRCDSRQGQQLPCYYT